MTAFFKITNELSTNIGYNSTKESRSYDKGGGD